MKKPSTNLRVPWHTHLYRAAVSLWEPGEPSRSTHLYRAWRSLRGDRSYAPPSISEQLSALQQSLERESVENRQDRARLEAAIIGAGRELESIKLQLVQNISRHFDRNQPGVVQTIEALGRVDKIPSVSNELDYLARALSPDVTTRDRRLAVFGVAIGTTYRHTVHECLYSHATYCARHGLTWATLNSPPNRQARPLAWYKIPLALQLLRHGHEYILHIDADCLITNPTFQPDRLINRLSSDSSQCMLISEDEEGINAGVFLLKNTPDAVRILNLIWSYRHVINHHNWEQEALKRVIEDYPQVASFLVIEPDGKQFNSFPRERREFHPEVVNPPNVWSPNDFICHFSGIREPELTPLIKKYARDCGLPTPPA